MRAIGYARVSTEEQARDGVSLANQDAKITMYCKLYGLELVDVVDDRGESSKTLKRPGIQDVLGRLDSGEADCLVIAKLDRLTRSLTDWQYLVDNYFGEKSGKRLCSVNDSIDTHSASGRLVLNVLMSVAQWEREAISERTKEALGHKKRNGERVGKIPYGYRLRDDGKTLVPDDIEQSALLQMKAWRGRRLSYARMARLFNKQRFRTRSGRDWQASTIRCILSRDSESETTRTAAEHTTR